MKPNEINHLECQPNGWKLGYHNSIFKFAQLLEYRAELGDQSRSLGY